MKKVLIIVITMALFLNTATTIIATSITYQETIPSVVLIEVVDSMGDSYAGTGFLISSDGLILTAAHVLIDETTGEPAEHIDICLIETEYDVPECRYAAEVWAYDADIDLALISPAYEIDPVSREVTSEYLEEEDIQAVGLPYVDLADYNPLLGDTVTILGFPSASLTPTITFTSGAVSAFTPMSVIFPEAEPGWIWDIQTDATINPGNSGGPAYNEDERVVGVVQAISTEGVGGNYGYIMSNDVVYLWFWDLVDQGALNAEWVEGIFSNDYQYVDGGDLDISDVGDYTIGDTQVSSFTDMWSNHPNYNSIDMLRVYGIIDGYPDGTFKPDGEINRAELTKMVVEMKLGKAPDATEYKNCFPDVTTEWYAPHVCYAKERNWVSGYPDQTFKPANNTNRAEAIKIILNSFFGNEENIPELGAITFVPDDAAKYAWYYDFLTFATSHNLLDLQHGHYSSSEMKYYYYPGKNMTRKEVAEMIYRLTLTGEIEKQRFINATVEATCFILQEFQKDNIFGPDLEEQAKDIYKKYGFDADDDEVMNALTAKYENDEDVLAAVEAGLEECLGDLEEIFGSLEESQ